jgi:hypothetical protein
MRRALRISILILALLIGAGIASGCDAFESETQRCDNELQMNGAGGVDASCYQPGGPFYGAQP